MVNEGWGRGHVLLGGWGEWGVVIGRRLEVVCPTSHAAGLHVMVRRNGRPAMGHVTPRSGCHVRRITQSHPRYLLHSKTSVITIVITG